MDTRIALERVKSAGLRLTPQRRAVISVLAGDRTHPPAEEVARRAAAITPGLSLSTVYKALHELEQLGLVREIEVDGVLRFDSEPDEHMHLVCEGCGAIADLTIPSVARKAIERAAAEMGRLPVALDLVVRDRCASCTP